MPVPQALGFSSGASIRAPNQRRAEERTVDEPRERQKTESWRQAGILGIDDLPVHGTIERQPSQYRSGDLFRCYRVVDRRRGEKRLREERRLLRWRTP